MASIAINQIMFKLSAIKNEFLEEETEEVTEDKRPMNRYKMNPQLISTRCTRKEVGPGRAGELNVR